MRYLEFSGGSERLLAITYLVVASRDFWTITYAFVYTNYNK